MILEFPRIAHFIPYRFHNERISEFNYGGSVFILGDADDVINPVNASEAFSDPIRSEILSIPAPKIWGSEFGINPYDILMRHGVFKIVSFGDHHDMFHIFSLFVDFLANFYNFTDCLRILQLHISTASQHCLQDWRAIFFRSIFHLPMLD